MSVSDMQRGAQRVRQQHRRTAVRRVRAYQQWLKSGSPLNRVPVIPSDHDFKIARDAR